VFRLESTGSFDKLEKHLSRMQKHAAFANLERFGQAGVDALSSATPVDEGLTATSWKYSVVREKGKYIVTWYNTNVVSGVPVVILIQYGHATSNGGWVEGKEVIDIIDTMRKRIVHNRFFQRTTA